MIIVTRARITEQELDHIRERIEAAGLRTHISRGVERTIIGCIGDETRLQEIPLRTLPGVESVMPVLRPFKRASIDFAAERTVVDVGLGATFGGEAVSVIAGPCSVEGNAMLRETAIAVKNAGASMLRGGAFKPRTSPYSFQGLGADALRMLSDIRREIGLPVVTEVLDTRHVDLVAEHADMLQVGARNMQNFALLAELGRVQRPVLLKRGLMATITELLMAAEYIMAHGNSQVVVCERGIRTFETSTRNTLDISAIPVIKRESHLPVIVDPSHAGGVADFVLPLALAAVAAGADGLIIEVHPDPESALSDGDQSLTLTAFDQLMDRLEPLVSAVGRSMGVAASAGDGI